VGRGKYLRDGIEPIQDGFHFRKTRQMGLLISSNLTPNSTLFEQIFVGDLTGQTSTDVCFYDAIAVPFTRVKVRPAFAKLEGHGQVVPRFQPFS
jgi:hypothetical protein